MPMPNSYDYRVVFKSGIALTVSCTSFFEASVISTTEMINMGWQYEIDHIECVGSDSEKIENITLELIIKQPKNNNHESNKIKKTKARKL